MTLNGYFVSSLAFFAGLAGSDRATSKNNCVKTNNILSVAKSFAGTLVSGNIIIMKFVRIFTRVL